MAFNFGAGLAKAAGGAAEIAGNQIKNEQTLDLQRELSDIQNAKALALDDAREAKTRARNTADLSSIRSTSELSLANDAIKGIGVGGSVDAESLAALKANPEALAAYQKSGAKGLLNATRQQQAEAVPEHLA